MYVNEFEIDGLNKLKSLIIGMNSFTKRKGNSGNDPSRSFGILNCNELKSIEIGRYSFSDYAGGFELFNLPKLESIEIGRYSFSDYSGGFELNNLPKLSTIKIGEIGSDSYNFYWSSFVIKGIIDMILLMNRSSTFEFH